MLVNTGRYSDRPALQTESCWGSAYGNVMTPGTGMWLAASPPAQTCFDNEQTSLSVSLGENGYLYFATSSLPWKHNDSCFKVKFHILHGPTKKRERKSFKMEKKQNTSFRTSLTHTYQKKVLLSSCNGLNAGLSLYNLYKCGPVASTGCNDLLSSPEQKLEIH